MSGGAGFLPSTVFNAHHESHEAVILYKTRFGIPNSPNSLRTFLTKFNAPRNEVIPCNINGMLILGLYIGMLNPTQ